MNNLEPCPFCGGNAEIVDEPHSSGGYISDDYIDIFAKCTNCGATSGKVYEAKNEAKYTYVIARVRALWNQRYNGYRG